MNLLVRVLNKNKINIKLKAAHIIWLLFKRLISAAEIFKVPCQFHVASHRAEDVCSRWTPAKARQRREWSGRKINAVKRKRGRERRRAERHSSSTEKRHDGISEIAPDIFACSMCIANRATASSCSSSAIFFSSSSSSSISCTPSRFSRLKQGYIGDIGKWRFRWSHLDVALSISSLRELV